MAPRVVSDTNTSVSGLLWHGAPRQVLDLARAGAIELFSSPALLAELADVLDRPKFNQRLTSAAVSAKELVTNFTGLVKIIQPAPIPPVVTADPDDDAVLACAVAAQAYAIVSGDKHLLSLGSFQGIQILSASALVEELGRTKQATETEPSGDASP